MDVVKKLVAKRMTVSNVQCVNGHRLIDKMDSMSRALFNLFAGNMVRDVNSEIHAKRCAPAAARTKTDDKRRKLTGIQKS